LTHDPAVRSAAHAPARSRRAHLASSLGGKLAVGLVISAASLLVAGCGSGGGGGDPPSVPLANKCGNGQHISSKIGGFYGPAPWVQPANLNSINCPYPPTVPVYSTCLTVTAVDRFDETGNGAVGTVYVQDDVSPIPVYAGTSLFDPGFTPPDLRVEPGDVLDVTGNYEEYIGPSSGFFSQCQTLPQVEGSAVFRFDGTVPAPVVITADDLSTFDGARQYESMLVTVKNVSIAANGTTSSGRYSAAVQVTNGSSWSISNALFDVPGQIPLTADQTFESVTGIVTYFYSYSLAPRSLADFNVNGSPPPSPDGGPDGGAGGG
jgi:hypothetical protein